jgi:hypothetical protein
MTASTIGVRAHWSCADCEKTETTREIAVPVANPRAGCETAVVILRLPPGWVAAAKETLCPAHAPDARRRA